jgi:chromosome segregation ATPase
MTIYYLDIDEVKTLKSDLEDIETDIETTNEEIEELKAKLEDLKMNETDTDEIHDQIVDLGNELRELSANLDDLNKKHLELCEQIDTDLDEVLYALRNDIVVCESDFTEYCQEMLQECGDLPKDLPWYIAIDWQQTADNMRQDYTSLTFNGTEYLYRA